MLTVTHVLVFFPESRDLLIAISTKDGLDLSRSGAIADRKSFFHCIAGLLIELLSDDAFVSGTKIIILSGEQLLKSSDIFNSIDYRTVII